MLKAARTVFAEMGYGAAGVRDIVRRTDLASGTFYNYFKDKAEIFEAVVREMTVELVRRHRGGRAKARTAEEFFRAHATTYITFVVNDPEILAFGRNNVTPIRALMEKPDIQTMSRQLIEDMTAAIERGVLPNVDPHYLVVGAVRRGVRDLGRHGVARSDRHRGRDRLRDPPHDGRDREFAEEELDPPIQWGGGA